jgi:hypothetical protein
MEGFEYTKYSASPNFGVWWMDGRGCMWRWIMVVEVIYGGGSGL